MHFVFLIAMQSVQRCLLRWSRCWILITVIFPRCSFIQWCMFYDQGFRPDLEDILDYLDYNRHFLVPCLDAPMSSVVMEDTDSLEMALPSGQTTMAPGTALSLFPRRSGSWQDKIASAARKTFSVPGFASKSHGSKAQSRTFLPTPALDRVQSSSVGAMQSGSAMESLLCEEEGDLTRSTSCLKQMSSVGTSERGDSGERGDSDYFSDYSKELCQTITTVWRQSLQTTSERGDSGERGDSDYFSDYSKELRQTITTVWRQSLQTLLFPACASCGCGPQLTSHLCVFILM